MPVSSGICQFHLGYWQGLVGIVCWKRPLGHTVPCPWSTPTFYSSSILSMTEHVTCLTFSHLLAFLLASFFMTIIRESRHIFLPWCQVNLIWVMISHLIIHQPHDSNHFNMHQPTNQGFHSHSWSLSPIQPRRIDDWNTCQGRQYIHTVYMENCSTKSQYLDALGGWNFHHSLLSQWISTAFQLSRALSSIEKNDRHLTMAPRCIWRSSCHSCRCMFSPLASPPLLV